ncbi:hypothetical protein PHJA_002782200 [Phtheirospermum japonicum]|uniref:Uncharacterized protein n=1 Tax=Phtheirospermum japonicum TaxID=374723 RepID=A0A830DKD0_9LAMI|nr:hypothetical protein PHJA_002782200 [Phtheirospermum japonicum]
MSLSTTIVSPITLPHVVRSENQYFKLKNTVRFSPVGLKPLRVTCASRARHASFICAAALNATCAAEQTQTVTRQSSTITVAPIQGKEKSPDLDDGGAGFPPRDDGDGGGGGGGAGPLVGWVLLFRLSCFTRLLKDQESEGPYRDERRR